MEAWGSRKSGSGASGPVVAPPARQHIVGTNDEIGERVGAVLAEQDFAGVA